MADAKVDTYHSSSELESSSEQIKWESSGTIDDPDHERDRLGWLEKTKSDIRAAVPHEDAFWNCWHCGNQALGTSFVKYPANKELDSPAVVVHIFECAAVFRRKYKMIWDWEETIGYPKKGYNAEGYRIDENGVILESEESAEESE